MDYLHKTLGSARYWGNVLLFFTALAVSGLKTDQWQYWALFATLIALAVLNRRAY